MNMLLYIREVFWVNFDFNETYLIVSLILFRTDNIY